MNDPYKQGYADGRESILAVLRKHFDFYQKAVARERAQPGPDAQGRAYEYALELRRVAELMAELEEP